jgi:hypothetical protein
VRERRGRALQGSMDLSKCQERLSNPRLGVYILPLPVTSRYGQNAYLAAVRDALAYCPRLNSNGKTRSQRLARPTVGPSWPFARTPRTVRLGPADCTRAGRGPSIQSTEMHLVLLRITDRSSAVRGLSAWKRIFSKTFAKNLVYEINIKNPRTVHPKGPDCPPNTWKLIFLKVFNETLLPRETTTHLNAMHANFWSKWHYGKSSQWNWSLLIVRLSILLTQSYNIL